MNDKNCRVCKKEYQTKRNVLDNDLFFANFDSNPVSEGHMKLIPKRHVVDIFGLTDKEILAFYELLLRCKKLLDEKYSPDGYNVGQNSGEVAGQTLMHLHIHLIPRYKGDVPDPLGGVRNVIPTKGNYKRKNYLYGT